MIKILLVDSDTFLANAIHKFQGSRWNHAGLIVKAYGEEWVVEALENGIGFTPMKEYDIDYRRGECDLLILEPKFDVNLSEEKVMKFILPFTRSGYEYSNLLGHQAIKFITRKLFGTALWVGRRKEKGNKKFICGEWVAFVFNHFFGLFERWNEIAPVGLYDSPLFKHKKYETSN